MFHNHSHRNPHRAGPLLGDASPGRMSALLPFVVTVVYPGFINLAKLV